jgi:hypothetical protein
VLIQARKLWAVAPSSTHRSGTVLRDAPSPKGVRFGAARCDAANHVALRISF